MENLIRTLGLWNWRITATAAVVGVGSLALYWRSLPPEIPLLYSRPWGQDQLVSPYFLWLLPLISLVCGLSAGIWGQRFTGIGVLRAIFLTSSLVAQIIMITGLVRILLLIT